MLRSDIVDSARQWLGTPFAHQARVPGQGVDCAQLVLAVAIDLGVIPDPGPDWQRYGRIPRPDIMRQRMEAVLTEIPAADSGPGDVAWMWIRAGVPMHLGIITPGGIIHASADAGRVLETGLGDDMARRIRTYWRFPGLED